MTFKKRILSIALCGCFAFGAFGCADKKPDSTGNGEMQTYTQTQRRAMQLGDSVFDKYIDKDYFSLDRDDSEWQVYVYDGYDVKNKSPEGGASVWHYTAVYALANRLAAITKGTPKEKEYTDWAAMLFDELDWYKGTADFIEFTGENSRTVYGVNRSNVARGKAVVSGDKNVYDDQMWLMREMLETYKITGEAKYLTQAEYLANYCLAGWDCSLDEFGNEYGGILWGPSYQARHTCSNGPIISPLVWLYEIYKDSDETIEYKYQDRMRNVKSETVKKSDYYLDCAKKVFAYTVEKLKKTDNLFYDNRGYVVATETKKDGDTEYRIKYTTQDKGDFQPESLTYNSGSPLSGAIDLYRATGDIVYLEQAKKIAAAAYNYFADEKYAEGVVRYPTVSITTWFNFVLYRGFYDLYSVWQSEESLQYVNSFRNLVNYAYENFYNDGLLPRDLASGWHPGYEYDEIVNVMDMASAAETMALDAQWEQNFAQSTEK